MKKYKFHNDTYDFDLILLIFDYKKKKECEKVHKILIDANVDNSNAYDLIKTSKGFAVGASPYYIVIDEDCFKKYKNPTVNIITTLQHECGHIRQFVLDGISEEVKNTDSEVYLRISDWCFKKCLNSKFFKKLLNPMK